MSPVSTTRKPVVDPHAAREAFADELAGQRLRCGAGGDAQRARPVANEVADSAGLALGHQAAVDEHDHAWRHALDLVQDVGGHEHGAALGSEPADQLDDVAALHRVEPVQGLVEQEQLGRVHERLGELTRCRMPFEKPPTRRSAASSSPTVASASAAALRGSGTSRRPAMSSTSSRAVRKGQRPSRSCTIPIRR